jgi:hypothetical protein
MRALALVLGVTLAACGFAPEERFSGAQLGDGIAPWRDLGPAPVCLGNEFLGPAGTPPGGFCFDRNQIEAPCTEADDCRSREACVCGRCTVAYCATASDCAADRICTFAQNRCDVRCVDAGDCAAGEECQNGACRGRCATSDECQTGEVCSSRNFCVTDACAVDGECAAGERCHIQRCRAWSPSRSRSPTRTAWSCTSRSAMRPSPTSARSGAPPRATASGSASIRRGRCSRTPAPPTRRPWSPTATAGSCTTRPATASRSRRRARPTA